MGRQIGGALLQQVGVQSTRGGAQHGGVETGASQRFSTWQPPTMLAWISKQSKTCGHQPWEE